MYYELEVPVQCLVLFLVYFGIILAQVLQYIIFFQQKVQRFKLIKDAKTIKKNFFSSVLYHQTE